MKFYISVFFSKICWENSSVINLLKPTGYVMHHQFNIQQLYALPTLYLCFVFIWEQTATCATYTINRDEKCLQRGTDWVFE